MIYTNNYNLPKGMAKLVTGSARDITKDDSYRVSITKLISPPLSNYLKKKHWNDLTEDVADHIWRITGSAYHYILSKANPENCLVEQKVEVKVKLDTGEEFTVVGILDFFDKLIKSLEDYKITSVYAIKDGVKSEWEEQLNCYAWLLRKSNLDEEYKEIKGLAINAILRDWNRAQLSRCYDGSYPKIPFKRLDVKLWSFEKQEKFVIEKLKLQKLIINAKTEEEVPICSAKDRWKKEDTFAVYKNKNKVASRVLNTEKEAQEWIESNKKEGSTYRIEKRDGIDGKCKDYCMLNKFCRYGKQYYGK